MSPPPPERMEMDSILPPQWRYGIPDEQATQRARYITMQTIGTVSDNPTVSLPAVAG